MPKNVETGLILVTPALECSAHSSIMRLGEMNGSFLHVATASLWRRSVDGTRVTSPRPQPLITSCMIGFERRSFVVLVLPAATVVPGAMPGPATPGECSYT